MNNIIAIDGTTASGKGSLAKGLAKYFQLPYLNTGALYRSVALFMFENNIDWREEKKVLKELKNISFNDLENSKLYTENIGGIASIISSIQEFRDFLFDFQVNFSKNPKGAILDGRDIGTVICPNARFKFFIVADIKIRAERRFKEMIEKGVKTTFEDILQKIEVRDKKDFERKNCPTKMADDAIKIDTSFLNQEEVLQEALKYIDIQK